MRVNSLVQADPLLDGMILEEQVDLRQPMDAKVIQRLLHTTRPDQMSGGKDEQPVGKLGVFEVVSDTKKRDGVFFRILG